MSAEPDQDHPAIPPPAATGHPVGEPARQPHDYRRGGTATLLTRVRPATGAVRATGVTHAPTVELHPWLQRERTVILAGLPVDERPERAGPDRAQGATWLGGTPVPPPMRVGSEDQAKLSICIPRTSEAHGPD